MTFLQHRQESSQVLADPPSIFMSVLNVADPGRQMLPCCFIGRTYPESRADARVILLRWCGQNEPISDCTRNLGLLYHYVYVQYGACLPGTDSAGEKPSIPAPARYRVADPFFGHPPRLRSPGGDGIGPDR